MNPVLEVRNVRKGEDGDNSVECGVNGVNHWWVLVF